MKKSLMFLVVCILVGGAFTSKASAQAANQFRRFDINWNVLSYSRQGSLNQYGGTLGFTVHVNEVWGVVADVGVHEPILGGLRTTTYRFGPKFSGRVGDRVTTFGQFLAGGFHLSNPDLGTLSPSVNGFSTLIGGGLDIGIRPWFAIRAVEGGYSAFHFNGTGWSNGARISSGIVFRFGDE